MLPLPPKAPADSEREVCLPPEGLVRPEPRGVLWKRVVLAGLLSLPFLGLCLWIASPGCVWSCGGYCSARYEIAVVDDLGNPLAGVEMRVLGPTRESWARDWREVGESGRSPPPLSGGWPVFEFDGEPLCTGADGRLLFHQAESGPQWCRGSWTVFGKQVGASAPAQDHTLEFRSAGYRAHKVSLAALDRSAWGWVGPRVVGPEGAPVPVVPIRVVLKRE